MKRALSLILTFAVLLSLCLSFNFTATAADPVYIDGSVDTAEYIGNLTVSYFNDIWGSTFTTTNVMRIITPGTSITGAYYEKIYAKYNEQGGYYEVMVKVANHRSYTQAVQNGYIGIAFNYAPLTSAGSAIAKANWAVWQHIRVGDRLYLKNIDLVNKTLDTSGTWGTSSYKSNSYIEVETVDPVYPTVTPYSNRSIVAEGDSITVGGGWTSVWGDYLSTTVINAGFGGDTSWSSLANRYDTYVSSHDPEIVIVSFGINDAFFEAPSTSLMNKYKTALRGIYDKNTANGAKTIFMTANVIKISAIQNGGVFDKGDYSAWGGEEGYLDAFIDCMRQVAAEKGCPVIDLYSMWKAEGLSPDNLIDSCHPNGHGYDRNWEVQRPALIKNMKFLCGNDIRVMEGTTAKHAIDGMPDCTVTVKDANGNTVANSAVLLDGYKVSYSYTDSTGTIDAGTYTVKTFAPKKALVSKNAPYSIRDGKIYSTGVLTVKDVKDSIFNLDVSVVSSAGTTLSDSATVSVGCTVKVDNGVASYTVAETVGGAHFELSDSADLTKIALKADEGTIGLKYGSISATALKELFNGGTLTVKDKNGAAVADSSTVSTGCVITSVMGTSNASLTIIVHGDPTGDGVINTTDMAIIKSVATGDANTDAITTAAADVDGDGLVSSVDILIMKDYITSGEF